MSDIKKTNNNRADCGTKPLGREQLTKSNLVFSGRVVRVFDDEVVGLTGRQERREVVRHNGGVGVIALTDEGEVVLVRQYRYAIDEEMLEIPAGKIERGENPEACGLRELSEEAGIRAERLRLLTVMRPTVGYCDEKIYIYAAEGLTCGEQHPDEGEELNVVRLPLAEAVERVMRGEINDAKTALAIMMINAKN